MVNSVPPTFSSTRSEGTREEAGASRLLLVWGRGLEGQLAGDGAFSWLLPWGGCWWGRGAPAAVSRQGITLYNGGPSLLPGSSAPSRLHATGGWAGAGAAGEDKDKD